MFKKLFTLIALGAATLGFGQEKASEPPSTGKVLVAYFSATGTTAAVAQKVATVTGGELYAITPKVPYSEADLDWRDHNSRCYVEMHDPAARPELSGTVPDLTGYSTVYIGFPIWWDTYPSIIATFIEAANLKGKVLIPFATSGGSSILSSVANLRKAYSQLSWKDGHLLNGVTEAKLRDILK